MKVSDKINELEVIFKEEAERKRKQEAELAAWIMKDRERYESIVSDPTKSEKERETAEKRLREIADWRS